MNTNQMTPRLIRREANREALKQFQRPGRAIELPWLWTQGRSKYRPHSGAKEQAKHRKQEQKK